MKRLQSISYKTLFAILFFSLAGIVFFLKIGGKTNKVSAAWWDEMWHYRKAISIGNSGTATTNQYIKITLDTTSLITANKMQPDCDDIRVTNINGKLLTHFIDGNSSYACNTSTTSIYVLADSIPSSGSTIYLYYGNLSATNVEPQLGTQQNPAISCKNILQHRSDNKGTQQYYITPTGNLANSIQVTCDMTYSSGGWIQVWHGLPSEAFANDSTHETINLSNNIIFNEMRVEGTNLNFNVVDTVTQTAVLGSSIRTYFNQVHNASDASNPKVAFHNLSGTQSINLTNNYIMYGYGNSWRVFYTCINVSSIDYLYLGGYTPTCTPKNSFNSSELGCTSSGNYCNNARTTTPKDSGLGLSLYQYQESSVYVRETAITLNINQSMGTIAVEETGGGPIAYWKFDEGVGSTAYDSSSNQNNGTISGATWQTEDQCISGKCLKFDGVSDYINIGTSNIISGTTYTVEAWFKTQDVSKNQDIFAQRNSSNSNSIMGQLYINSGKITFITRNDSGGNSALAQGSTTLINNTWYHAVGVRSGSNVYIYLNGKLEGSDNDAGGTITSNTNDIGRANYGGTYVDYLNSYIDDLKIYPYARTAAQIKLDYNSRGSSKGTSVNMGSSDGGINLSNGLVSYWKMDEGVGTSITDSSGLGHTGTFSGSTLPTWSNGKYGIGISFNGSSSYINFDNPGLSSLSNATISFWRKAVNSSAWLLFKGQTTSHYIMATSGTGAFYHANIGSVTKIYVDGNLATTPLTDNNWHHYVITGVNLSGWTNLNLSNYPNFHYNGQIDEIRLYNRSLSPAEVSSLYNYAPGPVGYWDFNDGSGTTAKDKSGNGLNGTITGNAIWKSGGNCKVGGCLTLDHVDDRITVNHSSLLEPQSITIEGWVKLNSTGDRQVLFTKWNGYSLEINSSGYPYLRLNGSSPQDLYSSKAITWGKWHHIATTLDSNTKLKTVYLDGINVGSTVTTGSIIYNQGVLAFPYSTATYGNGLIDEFKIYNYARTQKQIIEDMNAGAPATSAKSMLIYYKFDEGNGTTISNWGNGGIGLSGIFGTGSSSPAWTNDGKFGKALSFDGSDYIRFFDPALDNIGTNGDFTVTSWNKQSSFSGVKIILGQGYAGAPGGHTFGRWQMGTSGSKGWISLYGGSSSPSYKQLTGTINLLTNTWNQITTIFSRNERKLKLYINGKFDSQLTWDGYMENVFANRLALGYNSGTNNQYMDGLIDEVKIYNYALTADEIKQDYNQGSAISFGQTTQNIGGTTTSLDYCIPGDTSYCASPIAEYKMDEGTGTSTFDTSGNNLNAGFSGSPTWVQGKIGKALNFNGTTDFLNNTRKSLPNGLTFGTWIKTTSTDSSVVYAGNAAQNIIGDTTGSVVIGFGIHGGKVRFNCYTSSWQNLTGNISVNDGLWHYISVTQNSSGNIVLYVDGKQDITGTIAYHGSAGYNVIARGYSADHFTGQLDQIRIYNYARTPAQIAYDYNKGGPVGWWKFDECQGNIAYDWSGIGNTGVISIGSGGSQNSLGTCAVGTSAAWTNGATGKINSSLNFDGTDDYLNVPDTNNILDSNYMTITGWIYKNDSATGHHTIMSRYGQSFLINFYNNNFETYFYTSNGTCQLAGPSFTNYLNSWHFFAATYDGQNSKIYIDGKLTNNTSSCSGTINASIYDTYIGSRSSSSAFLNAKLDDVRIYNYALTSEQIKQVYNGGAVNFQ